MGSGVLLFCTVTLPSWYQVRCTFLLDSSPKFAQCPCLVVSAEPPVKPNVGEEDQSCAVFFHKSLQRGLKGRYRPVNIAFAYKAREEGTIPDGSNRFGSGS